MDNIRLRGPKYFSQTNIDMMPKMAVKLDLRSRQVSLSSGGRVQFDRILICAGASARPCPLINAGNVPVHYLRTAGDAGILKDKIKAGARIALIGGGYISLEIAATAAKLGCEVTILVAQRSILSRVRVPSLVSYLTEKHRSAGVHFHFGCKIESILTSSSGANIRLSDANPIDADFVVAGIGAVPNVSLALLAGLKVANGIRVDQKMRTSADNVYAAGDIAEYWNGIHRRLLRVESWQNAERQGRVAASTMLGASTSYCETPWFWTDQYDCNVQILGAPARWNREVVRGDLNSERFSTFLLDDGKIVGASFVNDGRNVRPTRLAIDKGQMANADVLADASAPIATAFR